MLNQDKDFSQSEGQPAGWGPVLWERALRHPVAPLPRIRQPALESATEAEQTPRMLSF